MINTEDILTLIANGEMASKVTEHSKNTNQFKFWLKEFFSTKEMY